MTHAINWANAAPDPVALVLLDWAEARTGTTGTTIAKRDASGLLYGCRDVTRGDEHDAIVSTWRSDAEAQGLAIDDRRTREYAFDVKLFAAVRVRAARLSDAIAMVRAALDCADANLGAWPSGDPIMAEVSLDDEDPELFEIDGAAV